MQQGHLIATLFLSFVIEKSKIGVSLSGMIKNQKSLFIEMGIFKVIQFLGFSKTDETPINILKKKISLPLFITHPLFSL